MGQNISTHVFENGDAYTGEFKNNSRHGKGTCRYSNQNLYEGQWADDSFDGHGMFIQKDAYTYTGSFKKGKKDGKGQCDYGDCQIYNGEWKDDKRHGTGIFKNTKKNFEYQGNWEYDTMSGKGRLSYSNKNFYEGLFVKGHKNGFGKFVCADGSIYEGNFENGKKSGSGKFVKNIVKYIGDWKDDKINGSGTQHLHGKKIYEGRFKNNMYDGEGTFYYENGNVYKGGFKDNKKDGKGIMFYYYGAEYEGEWEQDQKVGKCVIRLSNGGKIEGQYTKNEKIDMDDCEKKTEKVTEVEEEPEANKEFLCMSGPIEYLEEDKQVKQLDKTTTKDDRNDADNKPICEVIDSKGVIHINEDKNFLIDTCTGFTSSFVDGIGESNQPNIFGQNQQFVGDKSSQIVDIVSTIDQTKSVIGNANQPNIFAQSETFVDSRSSQLVDIENGIDQTKSMIGNANQPNIFAQSETFVDSKSSQLVEIENGIDQTKSMIGNANQPNIFAQSETFVKAKSSQIVDVCGSKKVSKSEIGKFSKNAEVVKGDNISFMGNFIISEDQFCESFNEVVSPCNDGKEFKVEDKTEDVSQINDISDAPVFFHGEGTVVVNAEGSDDKKKIIDEVSEMTFA